VPLSGGANASGAGGDGASLFILDPDCGRQRSGERDGHGLYSMADARSAGLDCCTHRDGSGSCIDAEADPGRGRERTSVPSDAAGLGERRCGRPDRRA
jgi:hypothetical protein